MIRTAPNKLIIEIDTLNLSPLEILGYLVNGLYDTFSVIDYTNGSKQHIENGIQQITMLLKALAITPEQLDAINKCAVKNVELKQHF